MQIKVKRNSVERSEKCDRNGHVYLDHVVDAPHIKASKTKEAASNLHAAEPPSAGGSCEMLTPCSSLSFRSSSEGSGWVVCLCSGVELVLVTDTSSCEVLEGEEVITPC
jgi:hypothetical protein